MGVVGSGEEENQHLTLLQELRPREQRVEEHDRYNNGSRIGTRRESTRELGWNLTTAIVPERMEPKREGLRKGKRSSPSSRGGEEGEREGRSAERRGRRRRKEKRKRRKKERKKRE